MALFLLRETQNKKRMRRHIYAMLLCMVTLIAMMMTSCKNNVESVSGQYTYYISGNVTRYMPSEIEEGNKIDTLIHDALDAVTISLNNESGQLEIINRHSDENDEPLLFVFTSLKGDVYNTTGSIEGKKLTIDNFTRTVKAGGVEYGTDINGYGELYDNTIVIALHYEGTSLNGESTIEGNDITCVAKRN